MFKQITNLQGDEMYLITSLWIFLVFFVTVGILLFFMKKDFINYMKRIPLDDSETEFNGQTEEEKKL